MGMFRKRERHCEAEKEQENLGRNREGFLKIGTN
jgi:hypothetical protein